MMISHFARQCGLSVDTIRFYVRRDLLNPTYGRKGGAHPYQIFSSADVDRTRIIKAGQKLGLSLEDIGNFLSKRTTDVIEDDIITVFLTEQRARLANRVSELQELIAFVDAKIVWLKHPDDGPPPPYPR